MSGINERYVYPVQFFDGGKNSYISPAYIADNESPDCADVEFDELGSVQTRRGTQHATSGVSLVSGQFYGAASFQPVSGNSVAVCWYNDTMYVASANTTLTFVTVPSSEGVFTGSTHVAHTYYENKIFMCQPNSAGSGIPYKYDGVDFTRWGIETPPGSFSLSTATTAGTAGLSGTYMYKVAYVNSAGVVGDLSSAVTLSVAASAIVSLASLPTAAQSFGVNSRIVYRTEANGTLFFLDQTLANNTTTTAKDEVTDANLGAQADLDVGYPISSKVLTNHKDRIFGVDRIDKAIVSWSEPGNPYKWMATGFEPIGEGRGQINVLGIHNDSVLCVKDSGECVLLFLGNNDPDNFLPIQIPTDYGSGSQFGVPYSENFMYFGTKGKKPFGFIGLAANQVINESITTDRGTTKSGTISQRIKPDVQQRFVPESINNMRGIVWRDKVWITAALDSSTTNNSVWTFDYQRRTMPNQIGAWVPFQNLYISYFFTYQDKLYGTISGLNTSGRMVEMDVEDLYSDDTFSTVGTWTSNYAINSYFYTKRFGMTPDQEQNHKDFRYCYLWAALLGDYSMNVYSRVDLDIGAGNVTTLNLNPGGTRWGLFFWGLATWGGGNDENEFDIDLGTLSGRRIQFRFTNQGAVDQAFKVNRMTIDYLLRPRIPQIS